MPPQEFLLCFVSAWTCFDSVLEVADAMELTCDDVVELANSLRGLGVHLDESPTGNWWMKRDVGWGTPVGN